MFRLRLCTAGPTSAHGPRPIRVGRHSRYVEEEVEAWISERAEEARRETPKSPVPDKSGGARRRRRQVAWTRMF